MTMLLRPLARLVDLALPAVCPGCGMEGESICARVSPRCGNACPAAGTPLGLAEGPPDPLLQLEWCAPFAGTVRRALHALKYAGERRLAVPLGEAVAARWAAAGAGGEVLVPVPVHATGAGARLRSGGADRGGGRRRARSAMVAAVQRDPCDGRPVELDRRPARRTCGARSALPGCAHSGVRGRWIVLVDDVVTTGATLGGARRRSSARAAIGRVRGHRGARAMTAVGRGSGRSADCGPLGAGGIRPSHAAPGLY